MQLLDHPIGNYRFFTGIAPYSAGVVALPGYEVVRVTLHEPMPYRQGFDLIERHLMALSRPPGALRDRIAATRAPAPLPALLISTVTIAPSWPIGRFWSAITTRWRAQILRRPLRRLLSPVCTLFPTRCRAPRRTLPLLSPALVT
ncbi:MAG: hypothetical protein R3E79_52660 [Caldilineaceae bacterium]